MADDNKPVDGISEGRGAKFPLTLSPTPAAGVPLNKPPPDAALIAPAVNPDIAPVVNAVFRESPDTRLAPAPSAAAPSLHRQVYAHALS